MRSLGVIVMLAMVSTTHAADLLEQPQDAEPIRAGRVIYQQSCATCHGAQGEGAPNWQLPNAQGEMPAPPHNEAGHTWKHADGMLYQIIQQGWRDPFNKTKRLTMPPFAGKLTPTQTRDVIAYLKTLWTSEQRRFQQDESRRQPFPPEAQ